MNRRALFSLSTFLMISSFAYAEPDPLPLTFSNVCRFYLETLNPFSAAKELYARGDLNFFMHPVETTTRLNHEYQDKSDSLFNRDQLNLNRQWLADAGRRGQMPVHMSDRLNRATAISQGLEYELIVRDLPLHMADEGLLIFEPGWAVMVDPATKVVITAMDPNGDSRIRPHMRFGAAED